MEMMALDEMDPDHRSKRGREVIKDTIHEQTIRKEREIKELREEIKELREEKKVLGEQIRAVLEKEIAIASGIEVRKSLEEQLEFFRQDLTIRNQQISQQICRRDQQISRRDQQIISLLQEKSSLRSAQEALARAESSGAMDNSHEWIKSMSIAKPELPCNKADVTKVLFPDVHGKLPVTKRAHSFFLQRGIPCEEYLKEADDSALPAMVSTALRDYFAPALSKMNTSAFLTCQFESFFNMFRIYSPHKLVHTLAFNCNEKTGESYSDDIVDRSRPDTLCVASGLTLLVGEDKFRGLPAAEEDLRKKLKMLPPIYYGELEFILGYIAAGSLFQWVYVGKNVYYDLTPIRPCLDLNIFEHRCQFYLSLGYAYHLLCSMVDSIPVVRSIHAMFSKDVMRDRTITFYPDCVRKSVKNFQSHCDCVETTVGAVRRAYEVSTGCPSLPQRTSDEVRRTGTYNVEYKPVGYPTSLRSEQEVRNMVRCVCEALRVLHTNGLVHRDIKLSNIVQIAKDQFMLIDLETAAASPNKVSPDFPGLQGWNHDTLVGDCYTTTSDMYQLGRLLASITGAGDLLNAAPFIQQLLSKNLSAELALKDLWLSSPVP